MFGVYGGSNGNCREWWRWWLLVGLAVAPFFIVFSRALYLIAGSLCNVVFAVTWVICIISSEGFCKRRLVVLVICVQMVMFAARAVECGMEGMGD